MAVLNNVPPPLGDPMVEPAKNRDGTPNPKAGLATTPWADYLTHLVGLNESFPSRVASAYLKDQQASIAPTDITGGTASAGRYRVSYYMRVVSDAGGETATVTIDWQDRGVARSHTSAVLDGGLLDAEVSGVLPIRIESLTPVRYSVTYAGAFMTYDLDVIFEEVQA